MHFDLGLILLLSSLRSQLTLLGLSTITPNETAELGRLRELEQRVMKSIHTFNLFFKPNQSTSTPWLVNTNTVTLTDLADLAAEITQAYRKVNDTALFTFEINGIKVAGPKTDADLRLLFQTLAARNLTTVTVDAKIGLKLFSEFKMEAVCTLYGLSYDPGNPLSQFPLFDCKAEDIDDELLSYVMDELNSRTLLTPVTQAPEAHQSIYVYCILHAIAKSFGSAFTILAGRYIEGLGAKGRVDYSIESRDGKILGVSEVKRQDYMQGIAQNAMQIRSALEYNNKGFDIGPRFGIATDADKWYFLEYTPHNAPRISKRYQAMFGGEFRREGVERIAGIINWLLLQSLEEESLLSDT